MPSRDSAITEIPNFVLNAPPHHLNWWNEDALRALADCLDLLTEAIEAGPFSFDTIIYWMGRCAPKLIGNRYFRAPLGPIRRTRLELAFRPNLRCGVPSPNGSQTSTLLLVARKPGRFRASHAVAAITCSKLRRWPAAGTPILPTSPQTDRRATRKRSAAQPGSDRVPTPNAERHQSEGEAGETLREATEGDPFIVFLHTAITRSHRFSKRTRTAAPEHRVQCDRNERGRPTNGSSIRAKMNRKPISSSRSL
jgi:hypothetical protein